MNAVAAPAADDRTALSPAQLKASLFADARQRVYAFVLGSRIDGLAARLATADVVDWHCLLPGALTPQQEARAPFQVELKRDAGFTDWLLFDAAGGFGEWGVVATSAARPLPMRGHARALCAAVTPDGRSIRIDWMDPALLRLLLPLADAAQLAAWFGPIDALVVTAPTAWQFHRLELGALRRRSSTVLKAAP